MKQHNIQRKVLIIKGRLLLIMIFLLNFNFIFSQQNFFVTPLGVLDKVFDQRGVQYNLADLLINNDTGSSGRSVLVTCSSTSIFNLYFESGSGMEDTSNVLHNARRDVVCKVFQDLSDFLTTPSSALLPTSTTKVNIWVRNINNVYTNPNGILGMASGFYCLPNSTTNGGITDNEIWKTIHTGTDSYLNITVPLTPLGGSTSQSGFFYHGMIAFNFNDTAAPPIPNTPNPIVWNTNLNTTSILNTQNDLYSTVLHEVTHALGFNTLIDTNGNSVFGINYKFYSRYDTFLKTNNLSQFLLAPSASACSLYDTSFTTGLSTAVLHPNPSSCIANTTNCSDALKFAGTITVPVYTPNCFSALSSLSHFEDTHFPTCNTTNPIYGNDNYFLMCNAGNSGIIRRYLKPEERSALCDIGYAVKNSYGVSGAYINGTNTFYGYGGIACGGITVAGVNDGINTAGSYTFSGTVVGSTATISISGNTILSNDIGATGGFQCLQDLTATATFPTYLSFTAGTTATTITFTSGLAGLHLLRYVPITTGGAQRGNITYVYVYVVPNVTTCSTPPNTCSLVNNGNFEANSVNVTQLNNFLFNNVCDWESKGFMTNYFLQNGSTPNFSVPCNLYGIQNDKVIGNNAYGSILCYTSGGNQISGILATRLNTLLSPNVTYQLKFDISQAEFFRYRNYQLQAFVSSINPSNITGFSISNTQLLNGILLTNPTITTNTSGWDTAVLTFTTSNIQTNLEYLYLGVLNTPQNSSGNSPVGVSGCSNTFNFTPQNGSVYYIDNVSLIATAGATLDIPSTICINQALTNLTPYLAAVPTNGFFSGNGVVLTNGVYSFNPSIAGVGTTTISYSYSNNLGCLITITDTIIVTNTTILTPTFSFATALCSGSSAPTLLSTSTNGVIGTWNPATVSNSVSANYVFTPAVGQCANAVTIPITIYSYPVISSLTPSTQTVCLNATPISLQVVAGTGLTYQWYSNTTNSTSGGTLLTGATNESLTPITTVTGIKYYYVLVNIGSCVVTSSVLTVIVAPGTATAGTLSGTQTLCKLGRFNPTTVFTATVAGGTWSSSNTAIAVITVTSTTTATIRVAPGTAIITYTVTGTGGCTSSVSRMVTTIRNLTPTFSQFPINLSNGVPDPTILCVGATPPILPTTSLEGVTGTWDPIQISNTVSGGYSFNPTTGQCAGGVYQSVIVTNATDFVANNDFFSVTFPVASTVTGSILSNDTYTGNSLNYVPAGLNYTITPVGTAPTFANGGISLNIDGTYTIQPNTTPGTYTYYYRLTSNCGFTPTASVTIVINNYVTHPGKIAFGFCFNTTSTQYYSSSSSTVYTSLFDLATVAGLPANSSNATIVATSLPPTIIINTNGTLTITSSLPLDFQFNYTIRSIATGISSNNIICHITIQSPFTTTPDTVSYNTSGTLLGGGSYNVLTNDLRNICNSTNNTTTTTPLLLNTVTLTGSQTTPYNYFKIQNGGSGNIFVNINANPIGGGVIPIGTYILHYTVCDLAFPAICATQTVTIYVTNSFRMSAAIPKTIVKRKENRNTQSICQIINFPDPNLKTKLLDSATCADLTNTNFILVDANSDGEIDTNEALQIGGVNLSNANITNLSGLEYFTNLTSIALYLNNVSNFNISLPNLSQLTIPNNPLTSFNPLILSNLSVIGCSNTMLTSLNTNNNPLLNILNITNTHITSLDLGISHNLNYLYCKNNPNLTSINIKNTSSLDYSSTFMQQDCWVNCPNLNNICADSFEIPALQSFLSGCGVSTSGININSSCALGVEGHGLLSDVRISPNPSNGVFEITFLAGLTQKTTATVYNLLGQKVLSLDFTQNEKTVLDLSGYANGVYFLRLKIGNAMVTKTILKE